MRQFRIFLSVLPALLLSWANTTAYAHRVEAENAQGMTIYYNYKYTDNGTELEVTYQGSSSYSQYNEYSGEVVIPESVTYNGTTYPVTGIGLSAFAESDVSSVTIPSTVTEIVNGAFQNCAKLTRVDIPNSVTTLKSGAFFNCSQLESVTIGSGDYHSQHRDDYRKRCVLSMHWIGECRDWQRCDNHRLFCFLRL